MRIFTNDVALRRIAYQMQLIAQRFAEVIDRLGDMLAQIEQVVREANRPIQHGPHVTQFRRRDRSVRRSTRP